jgi:hypothetical protein
LASPRPPCNGVPLMPLRGRTSPSCAALRASYVMPSYSPTVLRSAWERMFEFPRGGPPGYLGAAARPGRWASAPPGAGRRVGRGHRRARRARRRRARLSASPPRRPSAEFRPACALALAHTVASGTDLVVRARAVPMACGARRAAVATARRSRATVGFRVPRSGPRSEPFRVPYGYTGTRKCPIKWGLCLVCCLDILHCPWERLARLPSTLRAHTKPVPLSQLVVSPM